MERTWLHQWLATQATILSVKTIRLSKGESKVATADAQSSSLIASIKKDVVVFWITYRVGKLEVGGYVVAPKRRGKFPLVIYNRGGSENFGLLTDARAFSRLGRIASWGYVVIASQYRGAEGAPGKDEFGGADLRDVEVLFELGRQMPNVNRSRVGVFGHSRGAIMGYRFMLRHPRIHAAAFLAGSVNLPLSAKQRPEMKRLYRNAFGGSRKEMLKRSAIHFAHRLSKHTPTLLIHGTADWRVRVEESLDMSARLTAAQVPNRLLVFEGADHSLTEVKAEAYDAIRKWFERFLGKNRKMPKMKLHGK